MNLMVQREVRDSSCEGCKLAQQATGLDRCVTAEGPDRPHLLIVGKLPLSTRQREELNNYLREVDIDPDTTAYTAVNKCRTWDIVAGKKEQKACSPYLDREIELMKPEWILALGNEALSATVGRSGIMKYRGREFDHTSGAKVVPTISPSMVVRNPGQRAGFVADLAYVKRLSSGEDIAEKLRLKNVTAVTTKERLRALIDHLKTAQGIAFDIETNGFDEFRDDAKIVSLSITTWMADDDHPTATWVVPLAHPQSPWRPQWEKVVRVLNKPMSQVPVRVAHNGKFDCRWLRQFGNRVSLTADTMLTAHMLDENRPKGLKPLAQTLLGVGAWDISTKDLMSDPLKQVLKYNAYDTFYTAHVYFVFERQLAEKPHLKKLLDKMSVPASEAFTDIEREGIWVDREAMDTNAHISKMELKTIDDELMTYVPDKKEWPEDIKEVNFNPSKFSRWFLFDYLELPVLERGKEKPNGDLGDPSMAEANMQKLQRDHPHRVIDLLLARTKWQKYSSAFFSAYQEQIDHNDRIHTTFKLTGTVTGRLSSGKGDADKVTGRVQNRGVNLQQVPRDKFVRGIFGAPPGHVFIECDYSQVELRVAAYLASEENMKGIYKRGEDIHANLASKTAGTTLTELTGVSLMWHGIQPDRAGAKVLQTLWEIDKEGEVEEEILRLCRGVREDRKSWSRIGRGTDRVIESILEGRYQSSTISTLERRHVRTLRNYLASRSTPYGPEQAKQSPFQYRDFVSVLSRTGAPIGTEFQSWKEFRKKGKAVSFGFLYGMGARKFVDTAWSNYGVVVTEEEAMAFRKAFFDEFPMLHRWHNKQRALARKYKRVESPIGRARNLPDIDSPHQTVRAEAERQSINSPVQSFASDMAVMALVLLNQEFKDRGLETHSVGTVHDAINFQAPIDELEEVIPLIKHTMENVPMEEWFGVHLDVPIVADVATGERWGGAEELDNDMVTDPVRLREWLAKQHYAV